MNTLTLCLTALCATAVVSQDELDFVGSAYDFNCPEPNGLFPDKEQCDLYYICVDNLAEPALCDDGLLFDYSKRNKETCKLPFDVSCGDRTFVQEPQKDIDPRCPRANGFFDHNDPTICNKFYSCDKGVAFEMSCVPSLIFDNQLGTCVHPDQSSPDIKRCDDGEGEEELKSIDGFTCTGKEEIGPLGLLNPHPSFPHPTDCQFFITCFFGKEPNKLGCPQGRVYDADNFVCKEPVDVPECSCWYDCGENSQCPKTCNADCTCPSAAELEDFDFQKRRRK